MRNIPENFQNCPTLCGVWILTLKDSTRLGFSDHDRVLSFDGVSCEPRSGLGSASTAETLGFDSDNGDIKGVLNSADITAEDVRSGRFSGAGLDHYRVNWTSPDQFVHMHTGRIGDIMQRGTAFEAEWVGDAELLERSTGRVFSRMCDAEFGDDRCGLDVGSFSNGTQCPRTFSACRDQFDNSVNFRGFPYLLGDDALVATPIEGEARDGGSRYK